MSDVWTLTQFLVELFRFALTESLQFYISMRVKNSFCLYDSHLHLMATGLVMGGLGLEGLKHSQDLANLKIDSTSYRGDWLVGFGWDQNRWPERKFPTRQDLDLFFPNTPVALSRVDGHALWLNTEALKRLGYWQQNLQIPNCAPVAQDEKGYPLGIFTELAKIAVDLMLPPFHAEQKKTFLKVAQTKITEEGFQCVRDMSGDRQQWQILQNLVEGGLWNLRVKQNWSAESVDQAKEMIGEILEVRRSPSEFLGAAGIKIYLDGALGSEGAWISQNYLDSENSGVTNWDLQEVAQVMEQCWTNNLELSVHTLGDLAVDAVVDCALSLQGQNKKRGPESFLNLEHCEIVHDRTLKKLAQLPGVRAHMQPSHFLSDWPWLQTKIGNLAQKSFRWRDLEQAGVQVFFGSDSPIEPCSLGRTIRGLIESSQLGISLPICMRKFALEISSLPLSDEASLHQLCQRIERIILESPSEFPPFFNSDFL